MNLKEAILNLSYVLKFYNIEPEEIQISGVNKVADWKLNNAIKHELKSHEVAGLGICVGQYNHVPDDETTNLLLDARRIIVGLKAENDRLRGKSAVFMEDNIKNRLIEAIGFHMGWEESAVELVDNCIIPTLKQCQKQYNVYMGELGELEQ